MFQNQEKNSKPLSVYILINFIFFEPLYQFKEKLRGTGSASKKREEKELKKEIEKEN
jgi:hypothetical protein